MEEGYIENIYKDHKYASWTKGISELDYVSC